MTVLNHSPPSPWRISVRDAPASLVVFLVALPLCMGIAIASGAPVASGLVTGIVGGLVVGMLGGAPLQVSGPAAGLTIICAEVIAEFGLSGLSIVVLLAGAIQLVAGCFRLGQWFRAVSPAVVHGMLAGIGVLIVSSQLHVMVDDRPRQGGLANLLSIPEAISKGLPFPARDDRERRKMRLALLQKFGDLHVRQFEIASELSRVAPTLDGENDSDGLTDLARRQRYVLEAMRQTDLTIEDDAALEAARISADERLVAALSDLESGNATSSESVKDALTALSGVLDQLKNHDWAAKIGVLSILLIVAWASFAPKQLRFLPGPLLAVAAATAVAWASSLPVLYVELPDQIVSGIAFPHFHAIETSQWRELLMAAFFMALIASAETLLCATAVDRMHTGPHTNYDRELAAQGVGNILCGLVGGLPMTGVIVRSAANVQAGAQTRWSAVLHSIWLLVFVAACGPLLKLIPTAALAGVLVYTGFRLIDYRHFLRLWQQDRGEAWIMLITLAVIVGKDLLTGVMTGIVLSAVKLLFRFTRLDVRLTSSHEADGEPSVSLQIAGAATFLRLPILAGRLDEVPNEGKVRIEIGRLTYLDEACLELLQSWIKQREAEGQSIHVDRRRLKATGRGGTVQSSPSAIEPKLTAVLERPRSAE